MSGRKKLYFNRELSWLEFNQRVLDEACNDAVPLLERVKFLAITSSNLDEFFMVRVGGLQGLVKAGKRAPDMSGLTPARQLEAVRARAREMVGRQYAAFTRELEPLLSEHGICRVATESLTGGQRRFVERFFAEQIYPVVTPMAIHPEAPFPNLRTLSLHLAVRLKHDTGERAPRFAVIPMELGLQRYVRLPDRAGYSYMLVEEVVKLCIDRLFPGESVMECVPFRITRNADMSVQEDLAPDLLSGMQDVLDARRTSACVRLEVAAGATRSMLVFLKRGLEVAAHDVYEAEGPIDLSVLMRLGSIDGHDMLKHEPWPPQPVPEYDPGDSIFDQLRERDLLLSHPYEPFDPVLHLVEEAADDPDVLAIKQILYRTSRDSPVVAALMRAAEHGKYVTVICELKARFDEARNIEWARALETAGAQVIYGIKGLKTHGKICLVLRREADGIRRYMHFGTGNYNEATARLYCDISYMTSGEDLGADASVFFNTITGFSQPQRFHMLEAAPTGLRERLLELIEGEIERKRQGLKARIMAKLNSLVDPVLIEALYRASRAGVRIQLNVRGICCLRPEVPGLSENITVISIVDRYLEHARILRFYHAGQEAVFISSADWMPRNLDRRIELLVPVRDRASKRRLIQILETTFKDTVKARRLLPDGQYEPVESSGRKKPVRSQKALHQASAARREKAANARRDVFQAHRPPETDG